VRLPTDPLTVARGRERLRALFAEDDEAHGAYVSGCMRGLRSGGLSGIITQVWAFTGTLSEESWHEGSAKAKGATRCTCQDCEPYRAAIHGGAA
jgi:hypothetical protein